MLVLMDVQISQIVHVSLYVNENEALREISKIPLAPEKSGLMLAVLKHSRFPLHTISIQGIQ